MKRTIQLAILMFFPVLLFAQEQEHVSVHMQQSSLYSGSGKQPASHYDSLNAFRKIPYQVNSQKEPIRRVFGYQPYWGGSNFLNYQWDLLTDICHFSYEVDPVTGLPISTHDWESSPALDTAFAHGVKVHLCVTLFSGHGTFFTNPDAQQTLIDQIIILLTSRGAHGANMDIEALPSLYKEEFLDFMISLSDQLKAALPESELSIAAPAVNWSNKFNIPVLNEYIDFFMIMGYDYYWGGSSISGPVSPLYPMLSYSNYCFSWSLSYYQHQGVPVNKIIMGVPYYAYQWKTEGQFAPSATIGQGSAYTYRYIRDNGSGYYSPENKQMEPNSQSPYFSFESNGWNQCFLDDVVSMGKKFDLINRRDLAGVGIWALGYDNGHEDYWDLIKKKFGPEPVPVDADTIFDSGGPAFDYFDDEDYSFTLETSPGTNVHLSFSYLDTEENYDTLWLYDGPDSQAPLLGIYTGDNVPELIVGSANALTLRFYSDGATTDAGWRAVYDTLPVSGYGDQLTALFILAWPNPAYQFLHLNLPGEAIGDGSAIRIYNVQGNLMKQLYPDLYKPKVIIDVSKWPPGNYLGVVHLKNGKSGRWKFIVR